MTSMAVAQVIKPLFHCPLTQSNPPHQSSTFAISHISACLIPVTLGKHRSFQKAGRYFLGGQTQLLRRGCFNPLKQRAWPSARTRAAVSAPPAFEAPDIDNEEAKENADFEWSANWYAVAVPDDTSKDAPIPLTVLGIPMVLWFDRIADKWTCFKDQCPHRLAPLSEGRIDESGRLQCSYHGWSFKGDGGCACIPQAASEGPESRAAASDRARVTSYPVKVVHDLLFVWPEAGATERAEATPVPILEEMYEEGIVRNPLVRDLEYGYDMLVENLVDPSHLPYAHHGVSFLRRSQGKPLALTVDSKGRDGFTGVSGSYMSTSNMDSTVEFKAPARFNYSRKFEKDGKLLISYTCLYMTPTLPGKARLILVDGFSMKMPWYASILRPRWLQHMKSQDILDGDSSFLHWQQAQYAKTGASAKDFNKLYFMPTSADRYVIAFRQWFAKYGKGGVEYAPGVDPRTPTTILPKEKVLNRYEDHTKNCTTCLKALQQIKSLRVGLAAGSLLLLATAAVIGSSGWLAVRLALAVTALVMAGGAWKLGDLIQLFIFRGYNHHEVGPEKAPMIFKNN